jgi:cyclopropane fatty-acyl-phospholipid synthase-like methyltransferase
MKTKHFFEKKNTTASFKPTTHIKYDGFTISKIHDFLLHFARELRTFRRRLNNQNWLEWRDLSEYIITTVLSYIEQKIRTRKYCIIQ